MRVIVGVAVLVHIVVLVVLLLHRFGHCKKLLPGDARRSRRKVDTTHRADGVMPVFVPCSWERPPLQQGRSLA